jgi:hypothetical protein
MICQPEYPRFSAADRCLLICDMTFLASQKKFTFTLYPHHAVTLPPREQGERLVARVNAHPQSMAPKGLPSLRYFELPPAQPLRLAFVDPTGRYLTAWKPVPPCSQFDHYACFPASFRSFTTLPQVLGCHWFLVSGRRHQVLEYLKTRQI